MNRIITISTLFMATFLLSSLSATFYNSLVIPYNQSGDLLESGPTDSSKEYWLNLAKIAWRYYDTTVDCSGTGLPRAGYGWRYFTQWDLGHYILSVISAGKLEIIPVEGYCGTRYRLRLIVEWLKSVELTQNNQMYLWYRQLDGKPAKELSDKETNVSDFGYLLVALAVMKKFYPEFAGDIDYAILTRINTIAMAEDEEAWRQPSGLFKYLVAHGFKYFGLGDKKPVASALKTLKEAYDSDRKVITYGVELPVLSITTEPLVLAVFTLDNDPLLMDLALKVYIAQQRRYEYEGKYTAFSEGNTGLDNPSYVYEWIVTGGGQTWVVSPLTTPIIFFKAAIGLHAIFPRNYTREVISFLISKFSDLKNGFQLGIDENGRLVDYWVDSTNAITLMAAEYAMRRVQAPRLEQYPYLCTINNTELSATIVIGDTNPHGLYGWRAYTVDVIGSIWVGYSLGKNFQQGDLYTYLDTHLTQVDPESWRVLFSQQRLDIAKCFISIGGPAVNTMSYMLERAMGAPFYLKWINGRPYIESNLTGASYGFSDDFSWDHGIISISNHDGRYFISVWGLTHQGTQAASLLLKRHDLYQQILQGLAIIFKWEDENLNGVVDVEDKITLEEAWTN